MRTWSGHVIVTTNRPEPAIGFVVEAAQVHTAIKLGLRKAKAVLKDRRVTKRITEYRVIVHPQAAPKANCCGSAQGVHLPSCENGGGQ